jgi:hypothetical protein
VAPRVPRLLTIVAVAVLTFDGTALAAFGWLSGRFLLLLLGAMCFVSAGLILLYWRWYRQRLKDIADLRRGLADETRELRSLLREK